MFAKGVIRRTTASGDRMGTEKKRQHYLAGTREPKWKSTRPLGCYGKALHLLSGQIAGAVTYYWVVWGIRETASDTGSRTTPGLLAALATGFAERECMRLRPRLTWLERLAAFTSREL